MLGSVGRQVYRGRRTDRYRDKQGHIYEYREGHGCRDRYIGINTGRQAHPQTVQETDENKHRN